MLLLVADCLFLVDKYMEFVNEQLAAHSSLEVGSLDARCTYNSKAIATVGKYYGVDFRKVVEHYFKFMPSTFGLVYLACLGNCHNLRTCLYVGAVTIEPSVVAIFVLYGVAEQYGIDVAFVYRSLKFLFFAVSYCLTGSILIISAKFKRLLGNYTEVA